jgi:acyl-CoA reductase-like NAD-dependent aldehyde dehydrogenase
LIAEIIFDSFNSPPQIHAPSHYVLSIVFHTGKPKVDALLGEVMTTCEKIRCINFNGEEWLQPSYRPVGPMMAHKRAYVEYVPYGVLGVIAPWNYPFHNMLNHVISGIFSGNAVVSKVSEHTSWSSTYFGKICRMALEVNGYDPDLVQTVTGFGEAGAALVACDDVDKIIFTGSPGVGRKVMEGASKYLKPVILELGGKDPMVFCDDVKIKDVVPWALRGCFQNCGQNCCGVERLFVYESVQQEFIDAVLPRVKALRQGIPLAACGADGDVDCGAMVMEGQIGIIQQLVDDAVKKGATLHCGGKRNPNLPGQFYEPTLLSGITSHMRIAQEEVFGPIMAVATVPGDDDEECIRLVNNCSFGLGSSVYSGSQSRGMKIGKQIRSGMFTVNDFGVNYLIQSLPFGGVRESGFGRFAGPEGLRACCLERSIVEDRIPGVRTTIPSPIDYPIQKEQGLPFGMALIQLFYNESILGKIKGIFGLIKYG